MTKTNQVLTQFEVNFINNGNYSLKDCNVVRGIVDKICINVVGRSVREITSLIILEQKSFDNVVNVDDATGIRYPEYNIVLVKPYHLHVISFIEVVLHEIGHCLYPVIDNFQDEVNAMTFQIKAYYAFIDMINEVVRYRLWVVNLKNNYESNSRHYKAFEIAMKNYIKKSNHVDNIVNNVD